MVKLRFSRWWCMKKVLLLVFLLLIPQISFSQIIQGGDQLTPFGGMGSTVSGPGSIPPPAPGGAAAAPQALFQGFSLTPPPQDVSVQFLSDVFGVVDGVLHGTGTQIFGEMFGVFNSAVLTVAGAILT